MSSNLASLSLPGSVHLERTTPTFTSATVPAGLLRAHRTAPGVWGRLRVDDGEVTFVDEGSGESRRVGPGETQVIRPDTPHHVVVGPGTTFAVEFHR